jgi:hypothetical protein
MPAASVLIGQVLGQRRRKTRLDVALAVALSPTARPQLSKFDG